MPTMPDSLLAIPCLKTATATHLFRCQAYPKGFQSPVQVRPTGSSKQVNVRQQATGAQGPLQLGFTKLSLSISEDLGVASHGHR